MESVSPLGKKLSETVDSVVNSLISSEALLFKTFQESEFATFDIGMNTNCYSALICHICNLALQHRLKSYYTLSFP